MADPKIPLADLPYGLPGAYDKVAGVDTATGASRLFPLPQAGVPRSYATRASLPAASGFTEGYTVWVNNDPTPANNGTWAVMGGVWVQSADRVTGLEGRVAAVERPVLEAFENEITGTILEGQAVSSISGSTSVNASYNRTGYVRVFPGQVVQYRGALSSSSTGIAFYDAGQGFVSGIGAAGVTGNPFTFRVPAGVSYLIATTNTTLPNSALSIRAEAIPAGLSNYEITGSDVVNLVVPSEVIDGQMVVATTGATATDANYDRTDFIRVSPPCTIRYIGHVQATTGIAAYDEDKEFVAPAMYAPGSNTQDRVFTITDPSVAYIRACRRKPNAAEFKLLTTRAHVVASDLDSIASGEGDSPLALMAEDYKLAEFDIVDLVDPAKLIDNEIVDAVTGAVSGNAAYDRTDFIRVPPAPFKFRYLGHIRGQVGIAMYDEAQSFIGPALVAPSGSGLQIEDAFVTITDPACAFIRACRRKASNPSQFSILTTKATAVEAAVAQLASTGAAGLPKIVVRRVSATSFFVDSLCADGSYVTHEFEYVDTPAYAQAGWYSPRLSHNGINLGQGNFNAIYMLDDTLGDSDEHVGIGHGCEVFQWAEFYIDGREFDPATDTGSISGNEFRLRWNSVTLAAGGRDGAMTVPMSPEQPRFEHYMDCTIRGGGVVERYNRLKALTDSLTFSRIYMAMQRTNKPHFSGDGSKIMLNDKDAIRNVWAGGSLAALAPSTVVLSSGVQFGDKNCFADTVIATGLTAEYAYTVTTTQENLDNSQRHKHHILAAPNESGWSKFYFMPVYTSLLQNYYPEYVADVFNTGDIIETRSRTVIAVAKVA